MATTAMRKKNQLICAKIESVYDSDSVPVVGTDSLLAMDIKFKEIIDAVRRPANIASLSRVSSVAGSKQAEVTFSIELKGSGTAGVAPRIGALLKSCSFGETPPELCPSRLPRSKGTSGRSA